MMEKFKHRLKGLIASSSSAKKICDTAIRLLKRTKPPTLASHNSREKSRVITKKSIRAVEKKSIRDFLEDHRSYLRGRVLDFGAGEQPYQDLIEGEYVPFEKGGAFSPGPYDAVLMTQVAQYLPDPIGTFSGLAKISKYLVMTYPTNWYEVEGNDWWRFTKVGMERILKESGFEILAHEPKCMIEFDGFVLNIGYGVIAKSIRQS